MHRNIDNHEDYTPYQHLVNLLERFTVEHLYFAKFPDIIES